MDTRVPTARENTASSACRLAQTPLYVRPAEAGGRTLPATRHGEFPATRLWFCWKFCSLRLSVRTPPFHGGESGSIPLGSAIVFNGLPRLHARLPNERPIDTRRRAAP